MKQKIRLQWGGGNKVAQAIILSQILHDMNVTNAMCISSLSKSSECQGHNNVRHSGRKGL